MTPLEKERLETLFGARGKPAMRKAAIRIEDLDGILQMKAQLQSAKVSAAPTMDEHNALVADVAMLHRQLVAVMEALRKRLL